MTREYRVKVAGRDHRIRVDVPDGSDKAHLDAAETFAVSTALLVHSGYLPAGVINVLEAPAPPDDCLLLETLLRLGLRPAATGEETTMRDRAR